MQMANKNMKISSTSLVTGKYKLQQQWDTIDMHQNGYNFEKDNIYQADENVEPLEHSYTASGIAKWYKLFGK